MGEDIVMESEMLNRHFVVSKETRISITYVGTFLAKANFSLVISPRLANVFRSNTRVNTTSCPTQDTDEGLSFELAHANSLLARKLQ